MNQEDILGKSVGLIAKAIDRCSAIVYRDANNETHVVEPFVLGLQKETNQCILKCYKNFPPEPSDKKDNWETVEVDKIHNVQVMPVRVKTTRKAYNNLATDIDTIIASLPGYETVFVFKENA